jgi:ribosomal protein S18 acetylase RimI-like enzyme
MLIQGHHVLAEQRKVNKKVVRCLVGYIHGSVHQGTGVAVIPEQEPYVEIENVYVHPDFRHRYIGGQLMGGLVGLCGECIAGSDVVQ